MAGGPEGGMAAGAAGLGGDAGRGGENAISDWDSSETTSSKSSV